MYWFTPTSPPLNTFLGVGDMSALTSWPQFFMNQQLQPQLLKLEYALEEARKAGATIPDQLSLGRTSTWPFRRQLRLLNLGTMCCVGIEVSSVGMGFWFQMNQLLLQLHPWKLIAFTLLARKAKKVKGDNRKASKRAKENRSQSPKVMASPTARASRRETGKANQVGSQMIPLDTRAKEIV